MNSDLHRTSPVRVALVLLALVALASAAVPAGPAHAETTPTFVFGEDCTRVRIQYRGPQGNAPWSWRVWMGDGSSDTGSRKGEGVIEVVTSSRIEWAAVKRGESYPPPATPKEADGPARADEASPCVSETEDPAPVAPNEPGGSADEPGEPGDEPSEPSEPSEPNEPGDEPSEPRDESDAPGDDPSEPGDEPGEPADRIDEPGEPGDLRGPEQPTGPEHPGDPAHPPGPGSADGPDTGAAPDGNQPPGGESSDPTQEGANTLPPGAGAGTVDGGKGGADTSGPGASDRGKDVGDGRPTGRPTGRQQIPVPTRVDAGAGGSVPPDMPLVRIAGLLGALALFLLARGAERSRGHVQP